MRLSRTLLEKPEPFLKSGKGEREMTDKPESNEQALRRTDDGKNGGLAPPKVKRGDEIEVEGYRAIVYGILYDMDSEPGPSGYQIGVVFLDENRGMANRAKWSESGRCWRFLEGEIARDARPALEQFVQKLRFRIVK
jgi:hypothetical protein